MSILDLEIEDYGDRNTSRYPNRRSGGEGPKKPGPKKPGKPKPKPVK